MIINKNFTYLILVIMTLFILGLLVLSISKNQSPVITSYEECVMAGNSITETVPPVCVTPDGKTFVGAPSNVDDTGFFEGDISNLIRVNSVSKYDQIKSPITITGQARGMFYFEASFPVKLIDSSGNILAHAPAQAEGEWMTEEFVPFKAVLNFTPPVQGDGVLIFKNDNPSGMSENDKELRIPVKFAPVVSQSAKFDTALNLKIGDRITFSDTLAVELKSIDDSRCKTGVQCIWAGELSPLLIVGKAQSEVRLGTMTKKTVTFGNYTFTLNSATESTANLIIKKNN